MVPGDGQRPQRTNDRGRKLNQDQRAFKTLDYGIQGFLSTKMSLKEITLTYYRRQLENQVRECIQGATPLRELE